MRDFVKMSKALGAYENEIQHLRDLTLQDGLSVYAEGEIIYYPTVDGIMLDTKVDAFKPWLSLWKKIEGRERRYRNDQANDIKISMSVRTSVVTATISITTIYRGDEILRLYLVPLPNYEHAHAVAFHHLMVTGSHPKTLDTFVTLIMLSV